MSSKGEIFQQFMHEAYGLGFARFRANSGTGTGPTGPRKPEPVPEAGHAGPSPMAKEASDLNSFHENLQHYFNIHY